MAQTHPKSITILGATGSIGSSTIDIILKNPSLFTVTAIVANNNYKKLITFAKKLLPQYICIINTQHVTKIKESLSSLNINILSGQDGLNDICQIKVDICISAIMGFSGFSPTVKMIENCSLLAIANKESIICGGELFINHCKAYNTKIIPLDSEHNSIYQILQHDNNNDIDEIFLTASGGPFLNKSLAELNKVTIKQALNHPNWKMGKKITIDSATLINKGLEIIETYFLFNINKKKINAIIHPESIIHALVSFNDGSIKSFLSIPDMRIPIAHALGYPHRIKQQKLSLNINKLSSLNFKTPEKNLKHKAINIAKEVLAEEGIMPIVFNAANEVFVNMFLAEKIKFTDIVINIEKILNKVSNSKIENFQHIYDTDNEIRQLSYSII